MYKLRKLILFLFILSAELNINAQKVGLVLSGGGVKGLAHIGVIKALEENNIPIDYITGTSIGAIVGGLYAIGYSPKEMEDLLESEKFKMLAFGKIEEKYLYYYKKQEENSSWIDLNFTYDSIFEPLLPTNITPTHQLDLSVMEIYSPAIAAADYDFDSLFVPYRCIASDVYNNDFIVLNRGDLGRAIRASMSVPFYFRPLTVNNTVLFDGGIYNNFPADVMLKDFNPDILIGSGVASNSKPPKVDNLLLQVENMLTANTNYSLPDSNGVLIEPKVKFVSAIDFEKSEGLVDSGYFATMRQMDAIKTKIHRRVNKSDIDAARRKFKQKNEELVFHNVYVTGVKGRKQSNYIVRNLKRKKDTITMAQVRDEYYKMLADNHIEYIFPRAKFNPKTGKYNLYLHVIQKKKFNARFGGNVSSASINQAFIGAEYRHLAKNALSISGNTYFGRLYSSAQGKVRIDFSSKTPFYFVSKITLNRRDFFKSSPDLFFEDVRPSYLIENETNLTAYTGIPAGVNGKIETGASLARMKYNYYETFSFLKSDTTDLTYFDLHTYYLKYEKSTLNYKQFPTRGEYISAVIRFIDGVERHIPGSTSYFNSEYQSTHRFFRLNFNYINHFVLNTTISIAPSVNLFLSNQPFFHTYTSVLLSSYSYLPTPHSKSLFLKKYRAHNYLAGGLTTNIELVSKLNFRASAFYFQPYQSFKKNVNQYPVYGELLPRGSWLLSSSLVYQSPIGPVSFSLSYYDKEDRQLYFVFNIGYFLFNKRALD